MWCSERGGVSTRRHRPRFPPIDHYSRVSLMGLSPGGFTRMLGATGMWGWQGPPFLRIHEQEGCRKIKNNEQAQIMHLGTKVKSWVYWRSQSFPECHTFLWPEGGMFFTMSRTGGGRGSDRLASHTRLFPDLVPPTRGLSSTPMNLLQSYWNLKSNSYTLKPKRSYLTKITQTNLYPLRFVLD